MYQISNAEKELWRNNATELVQITFTGTDGISMTITDSDIIENSMSINRSSCSGDTIDIGSVVAGEVQFTLDNYDGRFNNVTFEGAELLVKIGVSDGTYVYYVPIGFFTIDESPKILTSISVTALDRMVQFDRVANLEGMTFPMTCANFVTAICNTCSVVNFSADITTLPNAQYSIEKPVIESGTTYRQLLSWCCEIMGVCAIFDGLGQLQLSWYTDTGEIYTESERFNSELGDTISVTGISIVNGDETILVGSEGYVLKIQGNPLITSEYNTIATNIFNAVSGVAYTAVKMTIFPAPYLSPLDMVTYVEDGESYLAVITDINIAPEKNTDTEGKIISAQRKGYATANPLTSRERVIIKNLITNAENTANLAVNRAIAFNELICNSLGLYTTAEEQSDGSIKYYFHDRPTLSESMVIFTGTSAGIAWTDSGWNSGSPVWSYGVTSAGLALFKMLSTEGIEVTKAGQDYTIQVTPSQFKILYRGMIVTEINAETMSIPKIEVNKYLDIGNIRIAPRVSNGATIGTNIYWIGV